MATHKKGRDHTANAELVRVVVQLWSAHAKVLISDTGNPLSKSRLRIGLDAQADRGQGVLTGFGRTQKRTVLCRSTMESIRNDVTSENGDSTWGSWPAQLAL